MSCAAKLTNDTDWPVVLELWEESLGNFDDPLGWCMMMGLSF